MVELEYDIEPHHTEEAWDCMLEANTGCGLGSYENVLSYLAWRLIAIISGDTDVNSFSFDDIHAKYDSPEAVYNLNLTPEFARALSIIITFPYNGALESETDLVEKTKELGKEVMYRYFRATL